MEKDRFKKVSDNYGNLFIEVYKEKGSDYMRHEMSIFNNVSKYEPDFRNIPILDIGTGDGLTIQPFVKAGCKYLTGLDLNPEMLETSRKKFGNKVKLVLGSATDLREFNKGEFSIITVGMCIHNLPKEERKKFWKEILRLNPKILCFIEKITGDDTDNYKKDYERELKAIKKIFIEKYGLKREAEEWRKHYVYDERENVKLRLSEIMESLPGYDIKVVFEEGMFKTILAKRI